MRAKNNCILSAFRFQHISSWWVVVVILRNGEPVMSTMPGLTGGESKFLLAEMLEMQREQRRATLCESRQQAPVQAQPVEDEPVLLLHHSK